MNAGQEFMEHQGNGSVGGEILAAGGAVQQIRTSYITAVAVQKPREIGTVKRKLLEEARLMGEDAYYGWGAGKNQIEGPSHDLALVAARCWGNCVTDMLPVQESADAWIFTATFVDLETGFTRTRQFRQRKHGKVDGNYNDERKEEMNFSKGQSKAERNVIIKALPSWLINQALEEAKKGVKQKIEAFVQQNGIAKAVDYLIRALGKQGVKEAQVLAKCAVAERRGVTIDHLVILRGDLTALENGQERVEELFPPLEQPTPAPSSPPAEAPPTQTAPLETAAPVAPPVKPAKKATLKKLEEWCTKMHLSPPERDELCSQYRVSCFAEMSEDDAQSALSTLADAHTKRGASQREPGDEPEGE